MNRNKKIKEEPLKRIHRKSILFNRKELNAINHYCRRYRIRNHSKFMREVIISSILKRFEDDHPSLFEDQPNLFARSDRNDKY